MSLDRSPASLPHARSCAQTAQTAVNLTGEIIRETGSESERIRESEESEKKGAAGCVGFPYSSGDCQVWTAKSESAQMTSLASNSLCASDTILRESLAELTL